MLDVLPPADDPAPPPAPDVLRPGRLAARLAALRPRAAEGAGLRAEALSLLASALADLRAAARARLEEGGPRADGSGLACARMLSNGTDEIVRAAFAFAREALYRADNPSEGERLGIVAVGGYGRGTLAPASDVDLLFLLPQKRTAWAESVVEAVLYLLWDLKLKVGHATRTIDETIREALADMTVRTALLEARHVGGDEALFQSLRPRFEREVVHGSAPAFVAAKLAERETRLGRAADSRYVVEPNVKEGKGGLRDVNTLMWIAAYVSPPGLRAEGLRGFVDTGLFDEEEARTFAACEAFLWRVRCHLHALAGRAEERLSFDMQPRVAERLGYAGHGGLQGVERFMKRYFLVAKQVGDLTAAVSAVLEARQDKAAPGFARRLARSAGVDGVVDGMRRVVAGVRGEARARRPRLPPEFRLESGRLDVADPALFAQDPAAMLRLYAVADREDLAIHPHATRLVTRHLRAVDAGLRADAAANRLFLDLLTSRRAPEEALRRMNESGLLGRFVPAFGRVVAMMQFNMYHHFTVDEHLIRSVGALADAEAGRLKDEHPLVSALLPTIAHRRVLYLALFLHDIAKGRPEDHSLAGARVARRLGERFRLEPAEIETLAWLVEDHLVMSTVAQSRDLADPRTIEGFAARVQTLERLKLLLVLTVCDIRAVGPGVWTGWKGELLRTLYYETEIHLAGGHSAIERGERVRRAQEELRAALADWPPALVDATLARHYPAYWLRVDLGRKVEHARLLRDADEAGQTLATRVATDRFRGVTTLTVLAPDHPRLLAILAGACAACGANIVGAQIHTTADGLALDTLALQRSFPEDEDEERRAKRITDTIEAALKGTLRFGELARKAASGRSRTGAFRLAPEVSVDNALSARHTVVEVSGLDRPGLLFELTTTLSRLNLNIASAQIANFGEKAVDVFYVTDLTGAKIASGPRQAAVRRALLDVFRAAEAKAEPRAAAKAG